MLNSALFALAVLAIAFATVAVSARYVDAAESSVGRHAAEYLDLVAALGAHSPESIDFQPLARHSGTGVLALGDIALRSRVLAEHIRQAHVGTTVEVDEKARGQSLASQLGAVEARVDQLTGRSLTFDEELHRLFGFEEPAAPQHQDDIHRELATSLPGTEPLLRRLANYQRRFAVPRGRLHDAVTKSIAICRDQTRRYLTLPGEESLDVQYVADKPWSGYSVYRGGYHSVMQVNRAFPLSANDVLMLACHEGYPGHHVYNTLREQHLVRERERTEATALPLFSPEGFRAEAVVSAAASMAFSPDERARIFREELFPLLDIDAREAERYVQICDLVDRLTATTTPVLKRYLAGELDRKNAAKMLRAHALMEHPDALLGYVDKYRGYSLAYTAGRERFMPALAAVRDDADRWVLLRRLVLEVP